MKYLLCLIVIVAFVELSSCCPAQEQAVIQPTIQPINSQNDIDSNFNNNIRNPVNVDLPNTNEFGSLEKM